MPHMAHSERCPICQPLTRAQAFDWIGKGYWVPVIHGNHWIRDDLDHALASLQLGDVVELKIDGLGTQRQNVVPFAL